MSADDAPPRAPLDAFAALTADRSPAMQGAGGVDVDPSSTAPSDTPAPPTAAELCAAQRWNVRGPALAARVAARYRGAEAFVPMPAGWTQFSRAMAGLPIDAPDAAPHGWRPGVYYVTAGTGAGKSQFAMQCAVAAAVAGTPAGIIGLELDDLGLYARAASVLCGDTDDTRGTTWERTQWSAFYNGRVERVPEGVQQQLAELPIYPTEPDAHAWPAEALDVFVASMREAESTRRVAGGGAPLDPEAPVFVVLDFLQLVGASPANLRAELRERIGRAAYRAREVARRMHAVVLVLSSIPRASYASTLVNPEAREKIANNEKVKEPSAATLRDGSDLVGLGKESGDVEFSADGVVVLCPHRRERRAPGERTPWRDVDVCVAKLRAGPGDVWCSMQFDGTRFRETPDAPLKRRSHASAGAPDPRLPPERDDSRDNPADEPATDGATLTPRTKTKSSKQRSRGPKTPPTPAAPDRPAETNR